MRNRTPISIFPFLSVLLSTMGVLSFLAVTFLLFSRAEPMTKAAAEPVQVRWVGAPAHVRPMLVETRKDALVVHLGAGRGSTHFAVAALEREAELVRGLLDSAYGQLGPVPSRTQLWFFFKAAIQNERRLTGSFTRLLHDLEIDNFTGESQRRREERYPILLIYPNAIATYELAAYLLETTTRLSVGLEPMLQGWELPYRKGKSS